MGARQKARVLREQAQELRGKLQQLEIHDWPKWLREADAATKEISELLRRAAELDRGRGA